MGINTSIPLASEQTSNINRKKLEGDSRRFNRECGNMYASWVGKLTEADREVYYSSERKDLLKCPQIEKFTQKGYQVKYTQGTYYDTYTLEW